MLSAVKDAAPNCRFYFVRIQREFWQGHRDSAGGNYPLPPSFGVWHQQGGRLRSHAQLSRGLRAVHLQRILFTTSPPAAANEFVTRKIQLRGRLDRRRQIQPTAVGNLDARRDWGQRSRLRGSHVRMLQQDVPDDYVVYTGKTISCAIFAKPRLLRSGLDYRDYVVRIRSSIGPRKSICDWRFHQGQGETRLGL